VKISEKDLDLLDRFINKKLSESEMQSVRVRLENDPVLASEYNELRLMADSLRISALNTKLKMLQDHEAGLKMVSAASSPKGSFWIKVLGISLILIIAAAVYFAFFGNKLDENYQKDILMVENIGDDFILHKTLRSSNDASGLSIEQRKAYDLYAIQEYRDAIPYLKELWQNQKDTLAYFYLGVSYFATGQQEKANEVLSDPALSQNSTYSDKIKALELK